jgi:cytochrome c556
MPTRSIVRRRVSTTCLAILLAAGCASQRVADEWAEDGPSKAAVHAVRAHKLKNIMRELDYLRSQRLPQELATDTTDAERIDDIRAAADSLAYAAEDIPSVLSEVRLSKEDENLFYRLAEQLNERSLHLRDSAGAQPATLDAAFEGVVSTCNACHSRFRVMPAANIGPDE